jgi:hypothetical protein
MSDWRETAPESPSRTSWSTRGLEVKLALAIALPLAAGALVASFLPWPEWRWPAFGAVALAAGAGAWAWIRGTLVRQLRVLERAMSSGRLTDLRGLPVGGGWGELSGLADAVAAFLARQSELERDATDLAALRATLATLATTARAWADDEHTPDWGAAPALPPSGDVAPLVAALGLAAARIDERWREAGAVSGLVRESVDDALARTSTAASTAERQFVESTSLLTVLRELRRWSGEVAQGAEALSNAANEPVARPVDPRAAEAQLAARTALDVAGASIANAALVVRHARELGDESDAWHDAAPLAALETAAAALGEDPSRADDLAPLADAVVALVAATRAVKARAAALARRTDDDLARLRADGAAIEARLAALVSLATPTPEPAVAPERSARVEQAWTASKRAIDRVQEMLREALARAEKLVKESERTSSESLRAGDAWTAVRDELDGLAARLVVAVPGEASEGAPAPDQPAAPPEAPAADAIDARPPRPLRVLGLDDLLPDDETLSHG